MFKDIKEVVKSNQGFFANNINLESSLLFGKFFITSEKCRNQDGYTVRRINDNNEILTVENFKSTSLIETLGKIVTESLNK